jgi:hypothetical protein
MIPSEFLDLLQEFSNRSHTIEQRQELESLFDNPDNLPHFQSVLVANDVSTYLAVASSTAIRRLSMAFCSIWPIEFCRNLGHWFQNPDQSAGGQNITNAPIVPAQRPCV